MWAPGCRQNVLVCPTPRRFASTVRRAAAFLLFVWGTLHAAESTPIPAAINRLGLDLYRAEAKGSESNVLLSPYSIQTALAMVYTGADGDTRAEMQRVLHFPADEEVVHAGFAELARGLKTAVGSTGRIEIRMANRLFAQQGFELKSAFLATVSERYMAPLQEVDFVGAPEQVRATMNGWVAKQTEDKIRDIVPPGIVNAKTRLAAVNAIYLKAAWQSEFSEKATKPEDFRVRGKDKVQVPTLQKQSNFRYEKADGYTVVGLPYAGGELQFVVILPDDAGGLATISKRLTAESLEKCAKLAPVDLIIHLPKLKLQPQLFRLSSTLQALGMKTAFDEPQGSADFGRMAARKPDEYPKLSEILHKAWLGLDEKGTEAAAATS